MIAAADAMGATRREIVAKVMLREARPGLVSGLTVTVIALIGYTAMAGTVGGGGLGNLAVGYGYERFETPQERTRREPVTVMRPDAVHGGLKGRMLALAGET